MKRRRFLFLPLLPTHQTTTTRKGTRRIGIATPFPTPRGFPIQLTPWLLVVIGVTDATVVPALNLVFARL